MERRDPNSRLRVCRHRRLAVLLLGVLLCAHPVTAQPAPEAPSASLELAVKAAFIYNFAKFTEWPEDAFADATSPLEIAVIAAGPLADLIEASVAGKQVHGRSLVVTRFSAAPPPGTPSHVLVLMPSGPEEIPPPVPAMADRPILVVTEVADLVASGAIINFARRENRIHFEINLDAADRMRLRISSNLLRVATIVNERGNSR